MIKGYKVRIYPNKTQVALIEQNFGACRWLYNRALALKRDRNETLTLGERAWECPQCGVNLDRDINAALNIKYIGINTARNAGIDACGDHANRRVDEARISVKG